MIQSLKIGIGKLQVLACQLDAVTNSFSMIKKSRFAFDLLFEESFAQCTLKAF
jgi:hypothetical protein